MNAKKKIIISIIIIVLLIAAFVIIYINFSGKKEKDNFIIENSKDTSVKVKTYDEIKNKYIENFEKKLSNKNINFERKDEVISGVFLDNTGYNYTINDVDVKLFYVEESKLAGYTNIDVSSNYGECFLTVDNITVKALVFNCIVITDYNDDLKNMLTSKIKDNANSITQVTTEIENNENTSQRDRR